MTLRRCALLLALLFAALARPVTAAPIHERCEVRLTPQGTLEPCAFCPVTVRRTATQALVVTRTADRLGCWSFTPALTAEYDTRYGAFCVSDHVWITRACTEDVDCPAGSTCGELREHELIPATDSLP